jgi:hypothetical protein
VRASPEDATPRRAAAAGRLFQRNRDRSDQLGSDQLRS